MKDALKPTRNDAKISQDARETVQECVSEFISFITSEALDCREDNRKTVNGRDLINSLRRLGFERYCENLEIFLFKYECAKSFHDNNDPRR